LAVEQSSQTTLTLACVIENFNITTFFNKNESEDKADASKELNNSVSRQSYRMISEDELGSNNLMFQPIGESNMIGDQSDAQNNNHLNPTESDLLSNTVAVENICINEPADVSMDTDQQLTSKEKDLIKIIQLKDLKIKELEVSLNQKDDEIANLKSHLDKFQSVFSRATAGGGITRKTIGRTFHRQRAQGISAEPQSQNALHELLNVSFPKYEKNEK
jgi:hypothetical protein